MAAVPVALLPACENVEKAPPQPERAKIEPIELKMDVPQIMRGTIAGESVVLGFQDVVVRGYGLVVGLKGTGSRTLNSQIRAHMLAEMRKMGVGSTREGAGDISPELMLSSEDTAVVIVEAVLPAGSVRGTHFDVRVLAEPSSGTVSLEGGRLYTTALRPGPLLVGGKQAGALAYARGPIFVNPFAEPSATGKDTVQRTVGRILHGGIAAKDLPVKLRLATPSHARAETIQNSVNSIFPREPGQRDPTARGENDTAVRITVPPSWRDKTREFIEVLRHSTVRLDAIEQTAMNIQRVLMSNPSFATEAALRWQALGNRAIPMVQQLYDYPEEGPRLSALQAGAKLDDPLAAEPLLEMARTASEPRRLEAISLLTDMRINPVIDKGLRALLDDESWEIRLAAVDALVERQDPFLKRIIVDDKFELYMVPSEKPMIYVSQSGIPRISVFGKELAIKRPVLVTAWSNRFMLKEHDRPGKVEVYYRKVEEERGSTNLVDASLEKFIAYLGHTVTIEAPQPGLGLAYGEVVGAIHQIWRQGFIDCDFKAEQDRLLAAILKAQTASDTPERPEFGDPEFDYLSPDGGPPAPDGDAPEPESENPFPTGEERLEWFKPGGDTAG